MNLLTGASLLALAKSIYYIHVHVHLQLVVLLLAGSLPKTFHQEHHQHRQQFLGK